MSELTNVFGNIADAIRAKNGSSDTYTPAQMASAIQAIPSGGGGGTAQIMDSIYFRPGTTGTPGDYIGVSLDGENWTDYYYQDFSTKYFEVPNSFVLLRYNSPNFCFYNNSDDPAEYNGKYFNKTDQSDWAKDIIVEIPWQTMFTGKINKVKINPSGPIPPVNGNSVIELKVESSVEEVTE